MTLWARLGLFFGVALLLAFLNLTAAALLLAGQERFSRPEPSPPYTYPVHLRGSTWRYFTPAAGRCIDWSFPALFSAAGALVLLRGLDRFSRRGEPQRPDKP